MNIIKQFEIIQEEAQQKYKETSRHHDNGSPKKYDKSTNIQSICLISSRLTFVPERIGGWNSKLIVNLKFKFK